MKGLLSKTGLAVSSFAQAGLLATTILASPDVKAGEATIEEGTCLSTDAMSEELQEHNMKPFMTGDFLTQVSGEDTPNDTSDDKHVFDFAMITATPDGSKVWILKGDTPKGTQSNEFCVEATAQNLRIPDNRGSSQDIPYKEGLMHPDAEKFCNTLTSEEDAPEGYDYFIENELPCASFQHILDVSEEKTGNLYAQAVSRDALKDGEPTRTVYTIIFDRSVSENYGFSIHKSFTPIGVTHPIGYAVNGNITAHAKRLEEFQKKQASQTPSD